MRLDLRLCLMFLSAILLISCAGAYDSFVIVKENTSSQQAILIQNFDSAEVLGPNTIIKLTKTGGDFNDLIYYIKKSNIQILVVYYSPTDNASIGVGTMIRQSTGINVMVRYGPSARERTSGVSPIDTINTTPISSIQAETPQTSNDTNTTTTTESTPIQVPPGNTPTITGQVISEQKSNSNNLLLASLIIGIAIIIGFVILALTLKKR